MKYNSEHAEIQDPNSTLSLFAKRMGENEDDIRRLQARQLALDPDSPEVRSLQMEIALRKEHGKALLRGYENHVELLRR